MVDVGVVTSSMRTCWMSVASSSERVTVRVARSMPATVKPSPERLLMATSTVG